MFRDTDLHGLSLTQEDSIVVGTYANISIDLTLARKLVDKRLSLFKEKEYRVLVDIRQLKSVDKDARDYFAKGDGVKGITAMAILAEGFVPVLIANLYTYVSKPEVPTRIFTSKKAALKWLDRFADGT